MNAQMPAKTQKVAPSPAEGVKPVSVASQPIKGSQNLTRKASRPSKKTLIEAIKRTAGNISEIAQFFGCPLDRNKIYHYIDKYDLRKELEASRELMIDLAESKVKKAVNDGDIYTSIFILRTLGRKRGYGDHLVIDPPNKMSPEEEVLNDLEKLANEGKQTTAGAVDRPAQGRPGKA